VAVGLVSLAPPACGGASFLVGDARRYGAADLVAYFQRRAVAAAVALIAVGSAALVVIGVEAPGLLKSMLAGKGLPFALATMVLTPLAAFLIWRGVFRWYRVLTVAAVGSMVFAWAFAQSPYLVPGERPRTHASVICRVLAPCFFAILDSCAPPSPRSGKNGTKTIPSRSQWSTTPSYLRSDRL